MNESNQIYVDQPQADLRSLRKDPVYLTLMRAYGSRFVEIVVAGVLINVFGLFMPLYSRLVYDKVIGNHITETLWALTLGMALFIVLELVLRIIRMYYIEQLAGRFDIEFDNRSVRRLLESVNVGVSQQVARFEDMHAAQREKELDGEKWTADDEYRYQEELRWKLSDEAVDTEE